MLFRLGLLKHKALANLNEEQFLNYHEIHGERVVRSEKNGSAYTIFLKDNYITAKGCLAAGLNGILVGLSLYPFMPH